MANARQLKTGPALTSRAGRLWTSLRSLFTANGGVVSVEFMLWMPVVFFVILFTVDVSLIYLKQADMWNVARDQARRLAVNASYTNANVVSNTPPQLFSSLQIPSLSVNASGGTLSNTDKIVTITVPLCKASLFGVVGCFNNALTLTARVTMASEY